MEMQRARRGRRRDEFQHEILFWLPGRRIARRELKTKPSVVLRIAREDTTQCALAFNDLETSFYQGRTDALTLEFRHY